MSQNQPNASQVASTPTGTGLADGIAPVGGQQGRASNQSGQRGDAESGAISRDFRRLLAKALSPLASLRLTIVLLLGLMVLIFCGTWAQRSQGIWLVMDQYFRSWLVMIPLQIFNIGPSSAKTLAGEFPWPGGATIGLLLLVNLIAAHAVRFKVKARGLRLWSGLGLSLIGITLIVWFHVSSAIGLLLAGAGYLPMLLVGLLIYLPTVVATALIFGRRFGIVLIHGSLILLLVGEGITRTTSVETQMPIYEGQTVHYTQDMREGELAVIEPKAAGKGQERVVAISQKKLRKAAKTGQAIHVDTLPFDIEVGRWMTNSAFIPRGRSMRGPHLRGTPSTNKRDPRTDSDSPLAGPHTPRAHQPAKVPDVVNGLGQTFRLRQVSEINGVGGQDFNFPGAIIRLIANHANHATQPQATKPDAEPADQGANDKAAPASSLGIYMLSARTMTMDTLYEYKRQTVNVGDRTFQLSLRFRRHYPNYAMTLKDFEHENYPGTDVPSSYASNLQLVNSKSGEDRPVRIEMNEPFRYGGQTFYQSGYIPGDRGTVLQVVENPASMMPYIACGLGGMGLLCHFCMSLGKHLGKGRKTT